MLVFLGKQQRSREGGGSKSWNSFRPLCPPSTASTAAAVLSHTAQFFFMLMCVFDPWPWFLSHPIEDSSGHSKDPRGERGASASKNAGLEGQSAFKEIYFREEFPLNEIAAGVDFLTPVRPCESLTYWLEVSAYLVAEVWFLPECKKNNHLKLIP